MNNVTFISSLFNIQRENMDGRKWDEYLKWFDITLKLKTPMVLFVQKDLKEFIQERRSEIPTEIIIHSVEEIPYYYLKNDIQNILDSDDYKKDMSDISRIECQEAIYSVIQYSKFPWLSKAVEINPFDSKFFFWIDAGGSRFFEDYDLTQKYPSQLAINQLELMGESFLVQMNTEYYPDLSNASELPLSYLYDNRSYVLGSIFGGHINSIDKIKNMIHNLLMNDMIENGNVNNEQIALGYLIKKYPDEFTLYHRTNGQHMDLFMELG